MLQNSDGHKNKFEFNLKVSLGLVIELLLHVVFYQTFS